jgi:hypothetical protein
MNAPNCVGSRADWNANPRVEELRACSIACRMISLGTASPCPPRYFSHRGDYSGELKRPQTPRCWHATTRLQPMRPQAALRRESFGGSERYASARWIRIFCTSDVPS